MAIDTTFWRDLQAQFRELHRGGEVWAINDDGGHWGVGAEPEGNSESADHLKTVFCSLAERAGIAAGAPKNSDALEWWLNLLDGGQNKLCMKSLAWRSADYCVKLETRVLDLEMRPPALMKTARRGYRCEVREWMARTGDLKTVEQAAGRLFVSYDTLKSIMSGKGKLRCSESTLKSVLGKIGCEP
jgi:hypothetical protein